MITKDLINAPLKEMDLVKERKKDIVSKISLRISVIKKRSGVKKIVDRVQEAMINVVI